MPKALNNEIMAVLRQYDVAGELSSRRSIIDAKEIVPKFASRIISFIFEKRRYYIIYDDSLDDSEEDALEEVRADRPDFQGRLVQNPHDDRRTFGLRFKGKEVYLFEVVPQKRRLDLELADRYPQLSRSTIQKHIRSGHVSVNGEVATQPKTDVHDTDTIALEPPSEADYSEDELPIIYLDDNVIVVNKPAGILTHSKGALHQEFTVADFFRRYTSHALETNRPGIVHRLDRDTSGVIIGARNDETAALLKKQFADRKTKKTYIAIVDGVPKVAHAVIDLPIGRNPSTPSTFRVDAGGKEALTTYEVLATNNKQSLVKLTPKTGRTHQLRVHLSYINTPIAGDRVYGREKADRLFLHAYQLEITLPGLKSHVFTAPVPKEFTKHFPGVKYD